MPEGGFRLEVNRPFLLAGAGKWFWLAGDSTLRKLEPRTGQVLATAALDGIASGLAATPDVVIVGETDGSLVGFATDDLRERFRTRAGRSPLTVAVGRDAVWTLEREHGSVRRFSLDGEPVATAPAPGAIRLSAGRDGAWYTSSEDTRLHFTDGKPGSERSVEIGAAAAGGVMTWCANAIWWSLPNALAWVAAPTLRVGPAIGAPAGPVAHLICSDGRIVGGDRLEALFVLDPAADDRVRSLETGASGELEALAAAGSVIWCVRREDLRIYVVEL